MTTIHAWFSSEWALRHGSSIFRKPGGSTVNVTRMNLDPLSKSAEGQDEKYVGAVVCSEDGGCVQPNRLVDGISGRGISGQDRMQGVSP